MNKSLFYIFLLISQHKLRRNLFFGVVLIFCCNLRSLDRLVFSLMCSLSIFFDVITHSHLLKLFPSWKYKNVLLKKHKTIKITTFDTNILEKYNSTVSYFLGFRILLWKVWWVKNRKDKEELWDTSRLF